MSKNPKKKLLRLNKSATNICYHIIWTTKYRKSLLTSAIRIELKEIIDYKCKQLNIALKAIEIMIDHIHIFIQATPLIAISTIIKHLKGYSSYKLRGMFIDLRSYRHLWTPSYYCETIGHINQATIIKYINNQTIKFVIIKLRACLILFGIICYCIKKYLRK